MLNFIKESLEGTDYDTVYLDGDVFSTSDFLNNLKGNYLVICDENCKKIYNLNAVSKIKLQSRLGGEVKPVKDLRC